MSTPDFQLKGSTVTVVVLELHRYTPELFPAQLEERIQQAPALFQGSPVVVDVEQLLIPEGQLDVPGLLDQCRGAGLRPIALRGVGESLAEAAADSGLAILPAAASRQRRNIREEAEPARDVEIRTEQRAAPAARPTRTITRPVRSGQQVYAEGGDLIVLAQVSEGAEVLADGNIHIYGALRGRALAGVHGDAAARIFCQHMDAELISVAGHFLLSDGIADTLHRKPAQVALEGDALSVEPL
ncbi:septum site-determining protein MinC [Parahaliea mediterranea]|uniref:Probable septum site-determining protein MinC n=1 Tax=Parahaliea mediterranea TaxID=651086 RepID=A0A939DCG4_9GAMM|nr:septum site-determining protein MinC [Parahaliea mediterranea]MBN7795673.1 septum site-determining protein MinC [Parahaliea mediterranea]